MDRGSQLIKGALDMCLLGLISEDSTYGYEMIRRLEDRGLRLVSEGSIYPRLAYFEAHGWVTTRKQVSSDGPIRKYYELTGLGRTRAERFASEWHEFVGAVELVIKELE